MNRAIRLLVISAALATLQGCVVLAYGPAGLERVPTAEAAANLSAALKAMEESAEQPARPPRTARNDK